MDVSKYQFSCQKALHLGLQYARSLGHSLLEVEHVALAMLRADLVRLPGQSVERLKRHLEQHLSRMPRIYGSFRIEFGKRLDRALDFAEEAAESRTVDEGILWAALKRESTILKTFMTKLERERPTSGQGVSGSSSPGTSWRRAGPISGSAAQGEGIDPPDESQALQDKLDRDLRRFTIDLTAFAERDELDPVVGRDPEVRRVLEILGRKKKNNPVLLGEPGVGKSAIAEALALRLSEGRVPESMKGKRVLSLDIGSMLAGARYRGEFEERMKTLLRALGEVRGQVILFIDELHMLVGAGNQEGGADAANLLKPALARGELQCLGATTLDEYRRHIEKDAALERRFQPIMVREPGEDTALAILRGLKPRYEIHHGVQIADEALGTAVRLSVRYLTERRLPDKAIDLVDEAASRLRLQIDSVPAILDELKSEIEQIHIERKAVGERTKDQTALARLDVRLQKATKEYERFETIWRQHKELLDGMKHCEKRRQELLALYENARQQGDFGFAARLQYEEIPKVNGQLETTKQDLDLLQSKHSFLRQHVGEREVAEVISAWTSIPATRLLEDEAAKLRSMKARLGERIFGQDRALDTIVRAIKRSRVGIGDPSRPKGVFLFIGPTGVGKTETAKALAEELFDNERQMVRVDMSEFMEAHNIARLIGSPPGYVGYGDGGELTEAVRRRPYCVVLFDEVEKAHPKVLDIMLQIFDDGRLTDARGTTVDFRNSLIIMTSNLPMDDLSVHPQDASDEDVRYSLSRDLRPELVNRIDEVVVFRELGGCHQERLLDRLLGELNGRLRDRQFRVGLGPRLRQNVMRHGFGAGVAFGGRALRRAFEALVVDEVSERLIGPGAPTTGAWTLELDEDGGVRWREEFEAHRYLPPSSG